MPDVDRDRLLARLPLSREDVDTIRSRMVAYTAVGVDPSSPAYPDLVLGTILNDFFGAVALEGDRLYDKIHMELPQKALPATTDGLWLDNWAETMGLERKDATKATGVARFTTPGGTAPTTIPVGTEVTTLQAGQDQAEIAFRVTAAAEIPDGGGFVDLPVEAVEFGSRGNVPAATVVVMATPIALVTVTNQAQITGGADIETDDELSRRVVHKLASPAGAGNVADYENWSLAWPDVGFVTVYPHYSGPGTVRVVVTDRFNNPLAGAVTGALQDHLDPVPGEGRGLAPIGAIVTVVSAAAIATTVASTLLFEEGYSLDGEAGTQALRQEIIDSVRSYVDNLPPGADVLRNKVSAAIVDVPGVMNWTALTINGVAGDLAIGALEVADLVAVNLVV